MSISTQLRPAWPLRHKTRRNEPPEPGLLAGRPKSVFFGVGRSVPAHHNEP